MNLSIVYFIVGNWTYLIATCKPLTDKIIELFSCHSLMYLCFVFLNFLQFSSWSTFANWRTWLFFFWYIYIYVLHLLLKPFANSGNIWAPDGNCAYNLKNSDESLTIELLGDYSRTQCILFGFFYNSSFWQTQGTSQPQTRNKTSTLRTLVRNLTEG